MNASRPSEHPLVRGWLIHTFSVLSLQLKKLRWHNKSAIDLSNVNPVCGHKEVPRSTGNIMVTTRYSTNRDPNRDKTLCDSTSNGTDQCQNGSSNPTSTRIVVAYPRPAFSATKRTDYGPTSFDQEVQVFQDNASYKNKEIEIPRSMVWWGAWAGEAGARASIQPSKALCILKKAPRIWPVRPRLVALVGRKKTVVRHRTAFPQKPRGSRLWFSRTGVQPSPGSSTIELPPAFAESGA